MAIPTEFEIQDIWKKAVALLESTRAHADDVIVPSGGLMDLLTQELEGDYIPAGLQDALTSYRSQLSSLVSPNRALDFLRPILMEYGTIFTRGSAFRDTGSLMRYLYERFHINGLRIKSRNIGYDETPAWGFNNQGLGIITRLLQDENGYPLEACNAERKEFRCRQDASTGAQVHAEIWEVFGTREAPDALERALYGSGLQSFSTFTSRNAGTGAGGSILQNSSFQNFSATGTPKFPGWEEVAGGGSVAQDTTNAYRKIPGSETVHALEITGGELVTLRQPLTKWRTRSLNLNIPYFLRVMVNADIGAAAGGTVTIRLGSTSQSINISALNAGWNELTITPGSDCWPREFAEADTAVEIEWSGSVSGTLLVDDVILAPWDLVDGTFWMLRGSDTPWRVDDRITFTDTGGAPEDAKMQWWLFSSGLGYLPSSLTPTLPDPS